MDIFSPDVILEKEFLDYLKTQLSQVMGPLAEVIIKDEIREMGEELSKIPHHRAADLVFFIAQKIPREEKKKIFLETMIKRLNEVNYP
jgi:hypothetical protein